MSNPINSLQEICEKRFGQKPQYVVCRAHNKPGTDHQPNHDCSVIIPTKPETIVTVNDVAGKKTVAKMTAAEKGVAELLASQNVLSNEKIVWDGGRNAASSTATTSVYDVFVPDVQIPRGRLSTNDNRVDPLRSEKNSTEYGRKAKNLSQSMTKRVVRARVVRKLPHGVKASVVGHSGMVTLSGDIFKYLTVGTEISVTTPAP